LTIKQFISILALIHLLVISGCNSESPNHSEANCSAPFTSNDTFTDQTRHLYFYPEGKCIADTEYASLIKDIPFSVTTIPTGYTVQSTARVVGNVDYTGLNSNTTAFVEVTNNSGKTDCFVSFEPTNIIDSSSNLVAQKSSSYVLGTAFKSASSIIYTNTCLEDGDTSFIRIYTSQENMFEKFHSIEADVLTINSFTYTLVESVSPGTLSWNGDDVLFEYTNTTDKTIKGYLAQGSALFLDENYMPIGLKPLFLQEYGTDTPPGNSFVLEVNLPPEYPSNSVELFLDYEFVE